MFVFIIIGLLFASFLLSAFSLWREMRKNIKTAHVTEELAKGRVIFHAPTHTQVASPDNPVDKETSP